MWKYIKRKFAEYKRQREEKRAEEAEAERKRQLENERITKIREKRRKLLRETHDYDSGILGRCAPKWTLKRKYLTKKFKFRDYYEEEQGCSIKGAKVVVRRWNSIPGASITIIAPVNESVSIPGFNRIASAFGYERCPNRCEIGRCYARMNPWNSNYSSNAQCVPSECANFKREFLLNYNKKFWAYGKIFDSFSEAASYWKKEEMKERIKINQRKEQREEMKERIKKTLAVKIVATAYAYLNEHAFKGFNDFVYWKQYRNNNGGGYFDLYEKMPVDREAVRMQNVAAEAEKILEFMGEKVKITAYQDKTDTEEFWRFHVKNLAEPSAK